MTKEMARPALRVAEYRNNDSSPGVVDQTSLNDGVSRGSARIIMLSSIVGTTIEWYDFFLYSTAASMVFGRLYFPADNYFVATVLAFATFFVGFAARPLGGLLFGHVGDRIGRQRTLVTTMVLMGLATAAMGMVPTYAQIGATAPLLLVVLRALQGLAVGGEWAGAVLMAVESAPTGKKARYGAWPQLGLAVGLGMGTGVFALLGVVLDEGQFLNYGWRVAFGASVVLVFVGLVVRLRASETPAFQRMRARAETARMPFVTLFRGATNRRNLVLGLLSRWSEGAAFNTWGVFFLAYATGQLHIRRVDALIAVMLASLVLAVLIPVLGRITDSWTPRRIYAWGSALFALSVYPAFAVFQTRDPVLCGIVVIVVLGIVHAVIYAPQGTLYAQLLPVRSRYTGMSVVYQFSGIYASGLTPLIVTTLLAVGGGTPWLACGYLAATGVIGVVASTALRERDLYFPVRSSEKPTPGATRNTSM